MPTPRVPTAMRMVTPAQKARELTFESRPSRRSFISPSRRRFISSRRPATSPRRFDVRSSIEPKRSLSSMSIFRAKEESAGFCCASSPSSMSAGVEGAFGVGVGVVFDVSLISLLSCQEFPQFSVMESEVRSSCNTTNKMSGLFLAGLLLLGGEFLAESCCAEIRLDGNQMIIRRPVRGGAQLGQLVLGNLYTISKNDNVLRHR